MADGPLLLPVFRLSGLPRSKRGSELGHDRFACTKNTGMVAFLAAATRRERKSEEPLHETRWIERARRTAHRRGDRRNQRRDPHGLYPR